MSDGAPSNQVLANEIRHVSKGVDDLRELVQRVLGLIQGAATKDELASVRQEVATLRTAHTTLAGEVTALDTRTRALEDTRTANKAVAGFLWTLVSLLGVGGLAALVKWLIAPQ